MSTYGTYGREIFVLIALVGFFAITAILWLKRQQKIDQALKLGIVYCPKCDSQLVEGTKSTGFRCTVCENHFERDDHVPEVTEL